MSLDVIRTRLDPSSPNHYKDIAGFVSDVRLIFNNTYLFYQVRWILILAGHLTNGLFI